MQSQVNSSKLIVNRIKHGDREVLVELYKQNEAMIMKYIREQKGRPEDAEDLLQDALVVLWQNARKSDFTLSVKPSTYIYAVVKNLWLKGADKRNRMDSEDKIPVDVPSGFNPSDSEMDFSIVRSMLNKMGETCRQVLLMFYFDGFDMQTIAQANNFANADVAKAKKHQCMKELERMVVSTYSSTDFY